MTHTNPAGEDVADSNGVPREDPGAYLLPFEPFKSQRLDAVPTSLRWWGTQDKCRKNFWYAALVEANKRYEELLLETPEAYPFPCRGDSDGKRLDEVPEDLIWWAIHPLRSHNVWHQNLVEASRHCFDKVYETKSPGSVTIWFGAKYKDRRFDEAYKDPGFIKFCLDPARENCEWYYRFEDLVRRYEAYRLTHRRKYRRRRRRHIQNPTGQLLGKWHDGRGSVEPDDEYEGDDFIVDDGDEEETFEEEGSASDYESGESTDDSSVEDDNVQEKEERCDSESTETGDTQESVSTVERPLSSRTRAGASRSSESGSDSDDDDDTPLDQLRDKTTKMSPSKQSKAEIMSSNNRRRSRRSLSEDSDTTAKPMLKRLKRRSEQDTVFPTNLIVGSAKSDPHSGAESCDTRSHPDEPETLQLNQLSQSICSLSLSQESAASPSDVDEMSGSGMYTAAHYGSRYRVAIDP